MADEINIPIAQIREGILDQFSFSFGLSKPAAEKATDEAIANTEFLAASNKATAILVAIAERHGWKRPPGGF